MQNFIDFMINHWILWGLFFIILAALAYFEMRKQVGGVIKVQPGDVIQLMNREDGLVIDTRNEEMFTKGHILNAENIENKDIEQKLPKLQKHKSKPVIVVCATGQSSLKTGIMLKRQGFEKVYYLQGGMNAWRNANLPLNRGKKAQSAKKNKAEQQKSESKDAIS